MHVIVDQNFQKDAKETFTEEDAQEDITDVQEDVWEKLAQSVQNLNVFHKTVTQHVPKLFWKHAEEYKELEKLSTEELLKQLQLEKLTWVEELCTDTVTKLLLENVEMELQTKNAELWLKLKLKKEKEHSEQLLWMHVIAKEKILVDLEDVQEDVWENHAALVQNLSAKTRKKEEDAEEDSQEDAENSKLKEEL